MTLDTMPTSVAGTPVAQLSPTRLNILRAGYLILGGGLVIVKWPELLNRSSWPLMEGVVNCMLIALSILALFGLRYPRQMLPLLLFEIGWKVIWLSAVAVSQWTSGSMDIATAEVARDCLYVVLIIAVVPWGYVYKQYLGQPAEPWRKVS